MKAIFGIFAVALLLGSCGKRNDSLFVGAGESAFSEAVFNDLADQFQSANAKIEGGSSITFQGACASITITPFDSTTWPKTMVIDFGTTGCVDLRGNLHKGKLNCVISAPWRLTGSTVVITPENYSVNGYGVEGTKTLINKGRNANGNRMDSVYVRNGVITHPDGKTSTWESDRLRTQIAGEATAFPNYSDDIFSISGVGSGENTSGSAYSLSTTRDLVVALNCRWVQDGALMVKNAAGDSAVVDYGTTGCDQDATVLYKGKTYKITLK